MDEDVDKALDGWEPTPDPLEAAIKMIDKEDGSEDPAYFDFVFSTDIETLRQFGTSGDEPMGDADGLAE